MRRYFTGLILLGLLGLAAGCGTRDTNIVLTTAPVQTLSAGHESEVRALIEDYLMTTGSSLYVTTSVALDRVLVLEYTASRIRVIACGRLNMAEMRGDGEVVETPHPLSIMQVFAFVRTDAMWNLAARYDFGDSKGAVRDWAYVSEAEKTLIGDLPSYTDLYFDCRIN